MGNQITPPSAEVTPSSSGEAPPSPADLANNPGPGAGADDQAGKEMTVEDYKKALEKANREAARYRTERNDLRPLADKARQQEESQKTEEQKAAERIAELERKNQDLILGQKRVDAASKAGVSPGLVRGSSEEEINEHAEALKAEIDAAVKKALEDAGVAGPAPVVPGENAGGLPQAESDWLRAMFNSK